MNDNKEICFRDLGIKVLGWGWFDLTAHPQNEGKRGGKLRKETEYIA